MNETEEVRLSREQADKIEAEMRRMEADPKVTKQELCLFMQSLMPCGHPTNALLTCDDPPYGCVICNHISALESQLSALTKEKGNLESLFTSERAKTAKLEGTLKEAIEELESIYNGDDEFCESESCRRCGRKTKMLNGLRAALSQEEGKQV